MMASSSSSQPRHMKSRSEEMGNTEVEMREWDNYDNDKKGVFLTWEDLWVRVGDGRKGTKPILEGLTGYASPGGVLALMGPSGCGKSTLLDALAGRLSPTVQQSGEILINGRKQELAYGTSAYVTQDDILITTLTVSESVYYSALLQLPSSMTRSEKKERAEMTIKEMGLQESRNTRIGGGWRAKGLSRGQIRRLSICMEILTRPKLLFLDEPTSGLDSAASYYVMRRIAKLAHLNGRTIITSIHQPSSEVFALFNNLCLLSSGRTVYFGPASATNEFFASNGFPCPTHQNPSDHFLKIINKDFDEDIEQGKIPTEEAISMLVESYKSSNNNQEVCNQMAQICKQVGGTLEETRRHGTFLTQCQVLTRRSFLNMFRDLGYYWIRLATYIGLAFALGSIFYNLDSTYASVQDRASLIMFVATYLTFMSIGGFPSFVEDMKVFRRERLNGHYGCGAFVIANTLSAVPYLVLISLIPGIIVYYMVGLRIGSEHFTYFVLVLLTSLLVVESLMMIIASIVPNFLMGIIAGAGAQALLILAEGYFRLPNGLPDIFWKYPMYHIAFHKYATQGLYKNEFEGLKFDRYLKNGKSMIVNGDDLLRWKWQVEMGYSKWVDFAILVAMVLVYRLLFFVFVKVAEKVRPGFRVFMCALSKDKKQVMVNPSATPAHGAHI